MLDLFSLPVFAPPDFLAVESGFLYALMGATFAGKAVLVILFLVSIVAWSVIFTKFRQVNIAEKRGADFLRALRKEEHFADIYKKGQVWRDCPLYELYVAGCQGIQGSIGADNKLKIRLLEGALERAVAEQVVRLESQVSILGTAVSTAPFLGLLGTVWGVMDAFTGVALKGSATIGAMAPGIASALITTVVGLAVALPSMMGYNILVANIRRLTMEMENFASEFMSIAHKDRGMKRISQRGMYNAVADINIVPLMDLVFNLLIVFMITTPLLEHSIDIKLPPTKSGTSVEPKDLTTLNLDAAGRIFLDQKSLSLEEVERYAQSRIRSNPDHAVLVRGDEKVPYGRFVEVLDHLKLAGVSRLGIVGQAGKK